MCDLRSAQVKRFTEFYKSHGRLTEYVPFIIHKNKHFIVQMVAYTMVHVNSDQGQSVIGPHVIELPVKNLHKLQNWILF